MTAAKSLQRKEVDRVAAALLEALKAECPDYGEEYLYDTPSIPRPESQRGEALWAAHRLAWSASARFTRREQSKRAKTRAQGEAFFDDKRIDQAIVSLERARTLVRNANQALVEYVEQIQKEAARLGLGTDVQDYPRHVQTTVRIADGLDSLVSNLKTFRGIPQARTQAEWDAFISATAERLGAAGFSSREVAALLTGRKPDKVDRATLERFRQRVRRLPKFRAVSVCVRTGYPLRTHFVLDSPDYPGSHCHSAMADGFLLLDEVARLARVSVDTVRFWIRAGKLPSVRPGRRRMVRREALEAFLLRDSLVERKAGGDVH